VTTSAPQWPGQEGTQQQDEIRNGAARPALVRVQRTPAQTSSAQTPAQPTPVQATPVEVTRSRAQPSPTRVTRTPAQTTPPKASAALGIPPQAIKAQATSLQAAGPGAARRLPPVPGLPGGSEGRTRQEQQQHRRAAARRNRFVVVRDPAERDLRAARRRARANLPSPVAVTREIALALLEVEAGCRSVSQLERIVSRELWEELEPCIGRRGDPLPSGRSVISICCQEDLPGLADTVAVVRLNHVRSVSFQSMSSWQEEP
jgi:hypothetical protein